MPFTLAHPAAVLPLRNRLAGVDAAALIVGSMAPDLAYFVPFGVARIETHSIFGLFWFCIPVGLAAWVLLHALLVPAVERVLPHTLVARFPERQRTWKVRALAPAALAVLLGAITHVAWDSFTHRSGVAVRAMAGLRRPLHLWPGYAPPVYSLLQIVSSLLGILVLAGCILRWYRRTTPRAVETSNALPVPARALALAAVLVPAGAVALAVLLPTLVSGSATLWTIERALARAAFASGGVFLASVLVTAIVVRGVDPSAWASRSMR